MEMDTIPFNRNAVAPIEILTEAWNRVRDQYWLFLGITAAGVILASFVPMGILMGPMFCGIYGCFRAQRLGQPVRFEVKLLGVL